MKAAESPIGPDNEYWVKTVAASADKVVAGWGTHGAHHGREAEVRELLKDHELWCLRKTQAGHPNHPLYLPKNLQLQRWP